VDTTGWLKGLRVTAGGTGIVSHAGTALLRALEPATTCALWQGEDQADDDDQAGDRPGG